MDKVTCVIPSYHEMKSLTKQWIWFFSSLKYNITYGQPDFILINSVYFLVKAPGGTESTHQQLCRWYKLAVWSDSAVPPVHQALPISSVCHLRTYCLLYWQHLQDSRQSDKFCLQQQHGDSVLHWLQMQILNVD